MKAFLSVSDCSDCSSEDLSWESWYATMLMVAVMLTPRLVGKTPEAKAEVSLVGVAAEDLHMHL
jgi:hypothetical protein